MPTPSNPTTGLGGSKLPEFTVSYVHGEREDHWIQVFQRNSIYDNDIVLDVDAIIGTAEVPPEVYDTLSDMGDLALAEIPAGALVPFDLPLGISTLQGRMSADIEIDLSGANAESAADHVALVNALAEAMASAAAEVEPRIAPSPPLLFAMP